VCRKIFFGSLRVLIFFENNENILEKIFKKGALSEFFKKNPDLGVPTNFFLDFSVPRAEKGLEPLLYNKPMRKSDHN
jgi:hypothetical protein